MAISVVCSGCQSSYQVPENLAGKRAKCKKCGATMEIPQPLRAASGGGMFDDLDSVGLTPLPSEPAAPEPQKATASAYADTSLDDLMSLSSTATAAPKSLATPVRHVSPLHAAPRPQASAGASIGAAIAATLLTLTGTCILFFALLCSTDVTLAFVLGGIGIVAAIACCVLGIIRKPGLSWSVFAVFSVIGMLGIAKAGYNVYLVPQRVREMAAKKQAEEMARSQGNRTWTPPSERNQLPTSPTSRPTPSFGSSQSTPPPWVPTPNPIPEDLKQPRTDQWNVTVDAPPDWAKVGQGRDFMLVLDEPGWNPVKHATGYASAIGFQHQLGGQDVFEVWDLAKRRKVGQLKGRNNFQGETALSPDGKYIAGAVRPDTGGWYGPIQVWSIAAGQKVCELQAPSSDRAVDILDYAGTEALLAVYRRGDTNVLKVWNIADGSEKLTINMGSRQLDRRRYALSPGRKYFVTFEDQVLHFYDLTDGKEQGLIYLPREYRCEAFNFSPDGSEFAAVCGVSNNTKTIVWQTSNGQMKGQFGCETHTWSLLDKAEKTGGMAIGWISNNEGLLIGGTKLVDRTDGRLLWSLASNSSSDMPAKLLDSDQLITVEKIGNSTRVSMRPFPFGEMDGVNKALAAGGTAIDAKLPPLGKADVSSAKELDFTSGVSWNVIVEPRPSMKTGTGNKPITVSADRLMSVMFSTPTQAQAVTLDVDARSPEHQELSPEVASYLSRFDLSTGKAPVRHKVPGGSKLMAISPSGTRAALTIGADEGRIDVYSLAERGSLLCAWRPYLEENPKVEHGHSHKQHSRQSIKWAGFVDEDHLLTMNHFDGQLALWKLPEMKALYRLRTGTANGGMASPGGKYVVVRASDRFSVIEAMTGTVAGELPIPFKPNESFETLAGGFSPDGQRFATTVPDVAGPFLLAYDFKTGREIARMPVKRTGSMQWCGPRQILIGGERNYGVGDVHLVDLDRRATVWRYNIYNGYRLGPPPDDRVWVIAGGYHEKDAVLVAQPFQLASDVTTAIASLPFNPPAIFGPGAVVSIDAANLGSAGSPDLSERVKQKWSDHIAARGARVGEGGLKLVASTSSGQSRTETYTPQRFGIGYPFPGRQSQQPAPSEFSFTSTDINLEVQLQDSSGKKLWETKSIAHYPLPYSMHSSSQDKSPQQLMAEQQATALKQGTEGFFLSVKLPFMIYPQPTDKDGQPGLGATMINLSGFVRERTGPRPIDADTAGTKEAIEAMYAKVLADNTQSGGDNWQWCAGLERPIVAMRWAIGVQMDLKSDEAKVELQPRPVDNLLLRDLERVAGPAGPSLVQMLRAKQSEGKFGTFAEIGDAQLREVVLLGTGERAQLAAAAKKAAVDLVLIIKLDPIVKGRNRDAQMMIEILDLASGKKLWNSPALLESQVKTAKVQGQDLVTELVDKINVDIDEKLALSPIATMPSGTGALRAQGNTLHRANPLAALIEVDYYLCREQIPSTAASAAYAKIIGNSNDAAELASEDLKTREAAIQRVLPLLIDKMYANL